MEDKKVALVDLDKRQTFYNVAAGSNTENVFSSELYVDFFLNTMTKQMDHCKTMTIQMVLQNTDSGDSAVTITTVPTFNYINFIEFYFNDTLLDTLRRDHIFVSHCFLNALNSNNYGNLEGFTQNDNLNTGGITSTITLAPGESKTYYLPIPSNIFCTEGLLLSALDGQLKVRCYFNLSSQLVITGNSTKLKLTDLQLLSSGIKYKDVILLRSIMSDDYNLHTIGHRWGIKRLGILDNSQSYDISLEMLNGNMEYLFFYILKAGASGKDLYQGDNPYHYDLKSLQLVDSNGSNSGFYSNMQSNFLRSLIPTQSLNSQWLSLFSLYMLPFCCDPYESYTKNYHCGSEYMDGKSYLRFQPNINSSLTVDTPTNNMNLVSIGFQDAILYITNGKLSIQFV